jgi:hypothetical protein
VNGFSRDQGVGDGEVVSAGLIVVVVVSAGLVVVVGASAVAVAVGLAAAGSVVLVFCSHAARSAALARMQMYFFIVIVGKGILL